MDCEVSSATVSWQPSVGAVSYAAELTASSGHTRRCTANHTNCQLSPLQCGEEYNVTVTARGDGCNSTAQMAGHLATGRAWSPVCVCSMSDLVFEGNQPIDLQIYTGYPIRCVHNLFVCFIYYFPPEPCVPQNLSVHYNVSRAQVMWATASGASSYSVEAVTDQGLRITCNSTNNSCSLNGLHCGQIYNVTVSSHNQACNNTVTSEPQCLMTGGSRD